jgi:hypothetical protein
MKRALFIAACLTLVSRAEAGKFNVAAYGQNLGTPVGKLISNVVSDEFTTAFPPGRYEIVVIYEHSQLGRDNVCYATAGIAEIRNEIGPSSSVPAWRFSSTNIDRNSGAWNVAKVRDCLSRVVHDAVENMTSIPVKELRERSKL